MKRDMQLVRQILFAMEDHPSGLAPNLALDGFPKEVVGYHVWLLGEAGLLRVVEATNTSARSPEAYP